ncbi:Predicted ATPase of the ABC class [Allopseudospirillum japonicum]|uniref:Predicted ATPase of the ABC class n=1 Tax=Allopseudospirillum japonicum TaxID=64971 RepID=A0A1H6QYA6_9GAMM|nr:ABC-ATPase domain-containing protein [Allopseudospirillum japonicum]SEI47086.1 Predicted ATPase of the ABC class [Allopseudospirillum japonicum]
MALLETRLLEIDRRGYRSYQKIKGEYTYSDYQIYLEHIQLDPHAPPSRVRIVRPWAPIKLDFLLEKSNSYQIAARDFIARQLYQLLHKHPHLQMQRPSQHILDATQVIFQPEGLEIRVEVHLPEQERKVMGKQAITLLTETLPKLVRKVTSIHELDMQALEMHAHLAEDQEALRAQLADAGLVAFVAEGSCLPRLHGSSDKPLPDAHPLQVPDSLAVTLHAPHAGAIRGLGIKRGVTLILGGGFHGKSTLLKALEMGVYNQIAGDGREYLVTDPQAVKIRAEEGRCVHQVDVSPYINHLPFAQNTQAFVTQNASGSTSQAASVQEALETGATCLLLDEDTSATNFMVRDQRMQALIATQDEPITPLIDRIQALKQVHQVSFLMVMGGNGDYLDVADTVIQMRNFQPVDISAQVREICQTYPLTRPQLPPCPALMPKTRALKCASIRKALDKGSFRIKLTDNQRQVRFGHELIETQTLEQIAAPAQLLACVWLWVTWLDPSLKLEKNPSAHLNALLARPDWYKLLPQDRGDLAKPRVQEVMAVLNRMRIADFSV